MSGLKEIGFSAILSTVSLLSLVQLHTHLQSQRAQKPSEPTMVAQSLTQDTGPQMNWGLKAIHMPETWQINKATGSRRIKVAIIDTGCDIHHPELQDNIWTNPGESGIDAQGRDRSSNGVDDDGNGFIDDVHGWDFVTNTPALMDEHGHGTHIAGIIGAARAPGRSAGGISPQVSLMILKYYASDSTGEENLRHTIEAIHYAVKMGANIINYSGGGILKSAAEEEALKFAGDHQVLIVAAAGNEGLNSDFFHFYPADYELNNILSVTAVDRQGQLLTQANYGRGTVDLAAPGRNIYSTLPQNSHGFMSGTSQATAFVTGVAALLMAQDDRFKDPRVLIRQLLNRGQSTQALRDRIGRGQMLDAALATRPPDLEISRLTE